MRPVIVPADALALVRSCLRAAPELADVANRVVLTSPRDVSTPWLRLTRIGGAEAPVPVPVLEVAFLDLAAFAPPTLQGASEMAHDLARRALGVLRAALGYQAGGGSITRVEMTTGPSWEPDESRTPPTPRFVSTVSVYVRTG
jgi:hypothetical protein